MVVVRVYSTAGLKPVEFNEKMVASIPRYEGLDGWLENIMCLPRMRKRWRYLSLGK